MPIHDWTRVDAGLFHAFHQSWTVHLCDTLNAETLGPSYFALPAQWNLGPIPDVLTLQVSAEGNRSRQDGGVASAVAPPLGRQVRHLDAKTFARKANRVMIRHRLGQLVAVIEIVSPGNKASDQELHAFVDQISQLIERGINVLVIDLFPPTKRDPRGIHGLIRGGLDDEDFEMPADRPLALASYDAGPDRAAFIELVAVGDILPDMRLFLRPGSSAPASLEASYETAWNRFPVPVKRLLDSQ